MLNNHVTKLYELLAKVMLLLEEEIDIVESNQTKNAVAVKKSLADTLNKLVALLVQLNKLSKDEGLDKAEAMHCTDQEIIQKFIQDHESRMRVIPQ
ncbi:MAG: hypothetical protein V4485_02595 [Pseudomonadota bacterium]